MAHHLALGLDPALLAQRAGLATLDPWQADVLRRRDCYSVLLAARQSGKSTICALAAILEVLFYPPALVLILSPTQKQSSELYRKVRERLHALGDFVPPIIRETELTLELATGSRIESLPGKDQSVRGFSAVRLLIVDEASRVDDALYDAVRPMLAVSRGRCVLLSTPWHQAGFFYDVWTKGGDLWHRVEVKATECPRISAEFLAQEREQMTDRAFRREYGCEFTAEDDAVFTDAMIAAAMDPTVQPLFTATDLAALDGRLRAA